MFIFYLFFLKRLVFIYDGFLHAEKKTAQSDKNRAFLLPPKQSVCVNRRDTAK